MELNMNLLHLRYFAKLAQTLHYTRAAEHLCIAQPSLSYAISQMEAELGVPLFEKVGKSIVLTHYGEQFLACAQQTLMTLDNGVDALQRVGRGEGLIRLGLLCTLGEDFVPGLAERFLKQYPEKISVLHSIQASPDSCLTGFAQGVLTLFSPLWRSFTPLTLPRPFLIHRFILPKAPVFVL